MNCTFTRTGVFSVSLLFAIAMPQPAAAQAGGLSTSPDWMAEGNQDDSHFGWSVASAGDVNGDGYSDVIVGACFYDGHGRVFVYHGSASGLSATANWTAQSDQVGSWFGRQVASAGDVNGDGYSDIIVGANDYDNGQSNEGRAFVYHGSASGLSATPAWMAEGNQLGAHFGQPVASAGDVNGDGHSDIIVGAFYYVNGQEDEGRAFVYHGSASGLSATPNWMAEVNQIESYLGISVASAGDVNRDGYSDVIVGAAGYDNGQENEGAAFVYHGSASGLSATADWTAEGNKADADFGFSLASAGDVNGDGYADVVIGSTGYDAYGRAFVYYGSASGLSPTAAWTAKSDQGSSSFARSVASAGDVNGDGYGDVIVGAPYYDNPRAEGRAFVYHGSASGLRATANWTGESQYAASRFGWPVASAGDVNGDGCSDVIVGALAYTNDQTKEGAAFVYHGAPSPPRLGVRIPWTLYE